ncbi:MAG TPA: polysaccharide deacetylase family protein [Ktedonobacteraceae bacterium]|nr:polysaccharide deacetylase family protein [Ktedonobacteraceae bacterium]
MSEQSTPKKTPILMYHSISDQATPKYSPFAIPPALFARQMEYLHQHNYTPLTVTQFMTIRSRKEQPLPEKPVLLTFDDGLDDFYTGALPVLQQYHFPATLYVVTGYMNGTSRWLQAEGESNRPMLTWEKLAEIQASGVECGGHTQYHPQLDTIPFARARSEIIQCKKTLEDRLGQQIHSFAYPYGYHTTAVKQAVQDAGYTSACAVKYEMCSENTDPFALKRLMVGPTTTIPDLEALLTTGYTSALTSIYKRARTPVWRIVRRAKAPVERYFQEKSQQPA